MFAIAESDTLVREIKRQLIQNIKRPDRFVPIEPFYSREFFSQSLILLIS
jgi:hypothetical protein